MSLRDVARAAVGLLALFFIVRGLVVIGQWANAAWELGGAALAIRTIVPAFVEAVAGAALWVGRRRIGDLLAGPADDIGQGRETEAALTIDDLLIGALAVLGVYFGVVALRTLASLLGRWTEVATDVAGVRGFEQFRTLGGIDALLQATVGALAAAVLIGRGRWLAERILYVEESEEDEEDVRGRAFRGSPVSRQRLVSRCGRPGDF